MVTPWESQSYFIESLSSYRYALKTTVVIDRVWNEKMQHFFYFFFIHAHNVHLGGCISQCNVQVKFLSILQIIIIQNNINEHYCT